jgi:hypothetical protein
VLVLFPSLNLVFTCLQHLYTNAGYIMQAAKNFAGQVCCTVRFPDLDRQIQTGLPGETHGYSDSLHRLSGAAGPGNGTREPLRFIWFSPPGLSPEQQPGGAPTAWTNTAEVIRKGSMIWPNRLNPVAPGMPPPATIDRTSGCREARGSRNAPPVHPCTSSFSPGTRNSLYTCVAAYCCPRTARSFSIR